MHEHAGDSSLAPNAYFNTGGQEMRRKFGIKGLICKLAGSALFFSIPLPAAAGGFLWLSGEFATPVSIYRYNIQTGLIDMTVQPSFGGGPLDPSADVYNNLAYDGSYLYVGSDDDNLLAKADPRSGTILSSTSYSPAPNPPSSWEDGAYHAGSGNLWRTGTTPTLLETTVTGAVLARYDVVGASTLDGLEWVGNTLYATTFSAFGSISLSGSIATFTELFGPNTTIPSGYPADQLPYGLALDQQAGLLYMVSSDTFLGGSSTSLWTVDPIKGTATFVSDLIAAGYPVGGNINPDAMGWVPMGVPEPSMLGLFGLAGIGLLSHFRRKDRFLRPGQ